MLLSKEEFLGLFKLPYLGYENPVVFIDETFGFSAVKSYPNGYGSLLRIFILKKALDISSTTLPLTITVTYGEKTDAGIRLSANTSSDPIELASIDEFYFDPTSKKFTHKGGFLKGVYEIEPRKIIEIINKLHTKPTRKILGLWLRIKIVFWRHIIANLFKSISKILLSFLYVISGIKITRDTWARIVFPEKLEEREEEKVEFTNKKTTDLFGYKASSWAIIFYCFLHLALFLIFFYVNYRPTIITTIFKNSFLTVIYVISTMFLLDVVLPKLLKKLISQMDKLFYLSSSRNIKI